MANKSLLMSDNGEILESAYKEQVASSWYGNIIGRGQLQPNVKRQFNAADVAFEGYLMKRGTYFRSW